MKASFVDRKGFILFAVIGIALILLIIIIPLIGWSVNEVTWTARSFALLKALNLADAGAELAVWEIVHNGAAFAAWSGINPKTKDMSSFQDNLGEVKGDINAGVLNTSPGNYLITSTGTVSVGGGLAASKTVKVKVFPHALFNNGIFGYNSVSMSGNVLADSYDSSEGPYTSVTAGSDCDIGTNGQFSRVDNAVVKGDVFLGPDGNASGNTPPYVTGSTSYYGNEVEYITVPFDSAYFIALPSQGDLNVSGKNSITIGPGDLRYENISVQAQAALTISAATRVYVADDISISGQGIIYAGAGAVFYIGGDGSFAGQGIVNVTGAPNNLQLYGLNSNTSLNFTGLNDFYGTVYAQGSSVYLGGNAKYFGAVAGSSVTLAGNAGFHYDESLSQTGPFSGYDIAYWQED